MTKKMTRKEALEAAIYLVKLAADETINTDNATNWKEAAEVLEKMVASIKKQSERPRTTSKARIQNEKLADDLVGEMVGHGEPVTTKWITEHVKFITTSQKATAVCKVAIEKGDIIRTVDEKKQVWYVLAE